MPQKSQGRGKKGGARFLEGIVLIVPAAGSQRTSVRASFPKRLRVYQGLLLLSDPAKLALFAAEEGSASLPIRMLLDVIKKANVIVRRADGTINRRLADLLEYKLPASEVPDQHGVSSKDIVINPPTGLWLRKYLPPASTAAKVINGTKKMDNRSESMDNAATDRRRRVIFYIHGGLCSFVCRCWYL
ncbi:hypothetical protein L7F22_020782 [Adiantum nelumboides]|nr:hypothetical protein [Adiantum nelumboides]